MSENQKKVWITGASSGIGRSTAEKFAKEGWKVAISARRKEILDVMAKNENISSYPLDVTNQDQINDTFTKIINDFGYLKKNDWFHIFCYISNSTIAHRVPRLASPSTSRLVDGIIPSYPAAGESLNL